MNPATYNITQVANLMGCHPDGVRKRIALKTIPRPMKRTGKTSPYVWRKSDIDEFLNINGGPAANDCAGASSFDQLIDQLVERKLAERIEQLRAELRQEMMMLVRSGS